MDYKCFRCQHELMIDNNFMATDIGLVPEDKFLTSADFMVTLMTYPYFKEENAKASVV